MNCVVGDRRPYTKDVPKMLFSTPSISLDIHWTKKCTEYHSWGISSKSFFSSSTNMKGNWEREVLLYYCPFLHRTWPKAGGSVLLPTSGQTRGPWPMHWSTISVLQGADLGKNEGSHISYPISIESTRVFFMDTEVWRCGEGFATLNH